MGIYDRDYMKRSNVDGQTVRANARGSVSSKAQPRLLAVSTNKTLSLLLFILIAALLATYSLSDGPRFLSAYPKNKQCQILPLKWDVNADGVVTISDLPLTLKKVVRYPGRLAALKIEQTPVGIFLEIKTAKCSTAHEMVFNAVFWSVVCLTLLGCAIFVVTSIFSLGYRALNKSGGPSIKFLPVSNAWAIYAVCLPVSALVLWVEPNAFIAAPKSNPRPGSAVVPQSEKLGRAEPRDSSASEEGATRGPGFVESLPKASNETAAYISEVLILTNEARSRPQSCGAESFPPANALELSNSLTGAAIGHAEDMARLGYFSHSSQDGRQLADRVNATGYSWRTIGENIAKGQRSPKQVVAGWVNSPGHCKNIMNPNFKQIGIGRSGAYWVQVFGTTK